MKDELSKHVFKKCRSVRNSTITVGTLNILIHQPPILFGDHTADKKITGTRRMAAQAGVSGLPQICFKIGSDFSFLTEFCIKKEEKRAKSKSQAL